MRSAVTLGSATARSHRRDGEGDAAERRRLQDDGVTLRRVAVDVTASQCCRALPSAGRRVNAAERCRRQDGESTLLSVAVGKTVGQRY